MTSEKVEIKQVSLGYKKIGVYAISDENGHLFEKMDESPRTFKTPSAAIAFLKSACEKYKGAGFIITMPKGDVKYVGQAIEESLDESKFGPHIWSKKNAMTIIERDGGSYDIYKCKFCGKEEKSYGITGHSPKSGTCEKNVLG
jgi:hypothetical protein